MVLCAVCLDESEESSCIQCNAINCHSVCELCFAIYANQQNAEEDIQLLRARQGRILCPLAPIPHSQVANPHLNCTSTPYSHANLAKILSEDIFEEYLSAIARVTDQENYEKMLSSVKSPENYSGVSLNIKILNKIAQLRSQIPSVDTILNYPLSPVLALESGAQYVYYCAEKAKSLAMDYTFNSDPQTAESLRRLMPNARQCALCSYGPMDFYNCDNLSTHHGQRNSRGGLINNACPNCNWFADNVSAWPRWDGKIKTGFSAWRICSFMKTFLNVSILLFCYPILIIGEKILNMTYELESLRSLCKRTSNKVNSDLIQYNRRHLQSLKVDWRTVANLFIWLYLGFSVFFFSTFLFIPLLRFFDVNLSFSAVRNIVGVTSSAAETCLSNSLVGIASHTLSLGSALLNHTIKLVVFIGFRFFHISTSLFKWLLIRGIKIVFTSIFALLSTICRLVLTMFILIPSSLKWAYSNLWLKLVAKM